MKNSKHRKVIFIIKLLVTLGLCALIFFKVDWQESWQALQKTSPFVLIVVFAGMLFNVMTSALKWKILLSLHGIHFKLSLLYRYYLIGSFLNNFLPSTIGGDGYRIYKTLTNPVSKSGALAAVFVERITGLLALMITGYLGAFVSSIRSENDMAQVVVFWGTVCITLFFSLLLVIRISPESFKRRLKELVPEKVRNAVGCLQDYSGKSQEVFAVLLLSLFFQVFLLVLYCLLLTDVVGNYVSIFEVSVAVSLSTLISLLPVSINGIGLLDGAFVYVLKSFQVGYEQALIVIILIRLLSYLQSLIGGILYFFEKRIAQGEEYNTV